MSEDNVTDAVEDPIVNSEAEESTETTQETTEDTSEEKVITPDWPEDWRQKLAGDDAKFLKRLERFQSPKDITKSWLSAEQKISSGELKQQLPDDATEEQIAAYRKEAGIPEKPEGYLEKLPDGLVIGEDDKELVGSYLERVHGKNVPPEVVAETLDWYYKTQEDAIAAQAEADKEYKANTADELRAEWGNEYRGNFNAMMSFLDSAPSAEDGTPFKDLLLGARLSDGTPLGDNPTALRWLVKLASDINPAGFVAPGVGGSQLQSIEDEIESIEKVMREDRRAYDKNTKMQERLRTLYDAQEKLSAK